MKQLFTTILFLVFLSPAFAQQDSLKQQKKDSLLNAQLDQQQNRLKQLSAERLADSLKKAELEKQLSSADVLKKAELLKDLNAFRQ
jgi:hypothetical protein